MPELGNLKPQLTNTKRIFFSDSCSMNFQLEKPLHALHICIFVILEIGVGSSEVPLRFKSTAQCFESNLCCNALHISSYLLIFEKNVLDRDVWVSYLKRFLSRFATQEEPDSCTVAVGRVFGVPI